MEKSAYPKRAMEVRSRGAKVPGVKWRRVGEMEMLEALARDCEVLGEGESVEGLMGRLGKVLGLRDEVDGVPRWRRCVSFLASYAGGMRYRDALKENGIDSASVMMSVSNSRIYSAMYFAARNCQLSANLPDVLDAAIDIAVNGEEKKVYDRDGRLVGVNRERSVKAMELLLKAGDERFAEKKGLPQVAAVTYNITMPTVALPPPEQRRELVIDVGEVGEENKEAALPDEE